MKGKAQRSDKVSVTESVDKPGSRREKTDSKVREGHPRNSQGNGPAPAAVLRLSGKVQLVKKHCARPAALWNGNKPRQSVIGEIKEGHAMHLAQLATTKPSPSNLIAREIASARRGSQTNCDW
jgi:hypothetical protein